MPVTDKSLLKKKSLPFRLRNAEVAASVTTTKSDRQPAVRRLEALETARSITHDRSKGFRTRMIAIEADLF